MNKTWWEGLYPHQPSTPEGEVFVRCPVCGQPFDMGDLDQVLMHYDHQVAGDASRAEEIPSPEEEGFNADNVIPFNPKRRLAR